jgi:hypothetical protein
MTKKQTNIAAARVALARFMEVTELALRGHAVGITAADRVRIVGCNPTMADIREEHVAVLRAAVEKAEGR